MENHSEEEISLKEIFQKLILWLQFLKSKWRILILAGLIGVVGGIAFSFIKKPIYTATLTFALEEKSAGGASGLSSIASTFGINLGGSEGGAFAGDNLIELMRSRLLIQKALLSNVRIGDKEMLLITHYINYNKLTEKWSENKNLEGLNFDEKYKNLQVREKDSILGEIYVGILKGILSVTKIDKKLSIISVKTTSENEIFSKLFCENLVKNVTEFYIETKVGKSRKNIELLANRVDSVKNELDQAMYGRASFADQNIGLIRQSAAVPKLKQEMRVQMLGTMYGELVKNLEFSKLALMREEPLIQIIDTPIYPLKKEKLSFIKASVLGGFLLFITFALYLTFKNIYLKKL